MSATAPTLSDALSREIEAAAVLRQQLAALAGDDEDLARDTIEGGTNLRELLRDMIRSTGEDEALVAGLSAYIETLEARQKRIKDRIAHKRVLMATGLEMAGLPKLETDVGTISISKVQPKVIVTDEALIPTRFWKAADPTLDKKAIAERIKSGEAVPGAELSNGGQTVTIRRK